MAGRSTPATVALDRAGVPYRLHTYRHDPRTTSYGEEAIVELGVDASRVYKTLLASVDGSLAVAIVAVPTTLDLKALAAVLGGKRAGMADPGDAERVTGYVVGAISPLGQRRALPTVLDAAADSESIFVSAGRRGLELELAPADLLRLTGGRLAQIASR